MNRERIVTQQMVVGPLASIRKRMKLGPYVTRAQITLKWAGGVARVL
jgi:hypothetical protein